MGITGREVRVSRTFLLTVRALPIQSEQDLDAAQKVIDGLLTKGKLLSGEMLYLDALSDLVATYEGQHYRISPASDADMLRHLIEARGMSQSALSREAGIPKSTISEILSGKKNFSRSLIRKLSDYFDVDGSVLAHNL